MTVTSKVHVQGKRVETGPTAQLTATNAKLILDGPTVTNTTATPATLTAWLVPSGGAADDTNKVIDEVSIGAHDTYLCPELAGRRLDSGDALWAQASDANALSLRVDGRIVTG